MAVCEFYELDWRVCDLFGRLMTICQCMGICLWLFASSMFFGYNCAEVTNGPIVCGGWIIG
jgi:hypothetical protein